MALPAQAISDIVSAGASHINNLTSGIFNLISTNKTNKANLKMTRETNAANERINQSQIDYNWDMWHAQNEYNNPAAQRQRLVDAGLNPIYYGLDGNSAGAGNAFTPIAAQQASPSIPQNFDFLGDVLLKAAQLRNIMADTKKKESESGLNDEEAENLRQLRSGMLTIQGQQIQLNMDQHELNGAKRDEILASTQSIKQSVLESQQRIEDLKSQISSREFQSKIQQAQYELDKMYKEGILNYQEKQLALGWFDAYTQRMNASTNYYNAETSRMSAKSQIADTAATQKSRIGFMNSISNFNNTNAGYIRDRNKREQGVYKFEYITKAADAFSSAVDAVFKPFEKMTNVVGANLDNAGKVMNIMP